MKQEFFTARLLQIQLEMEAVKAEIAGMESEDADRTRQGYALAWGPAMFNETAATLRSLQGDIKSLMEEYSKGEQAPAAVETKPGTLASAKGIIAGLGNITESTMGDETSLGWRNIDSRKVSVVVAALQVLLRPAAGDNERLYTSKELHRIVSEAIITFKGREVSTGEFVDFMENLEDAGE